MPVLLKKYLKQNGQIVGFNIDPKFNNALDGLMILDLFDVPPSTIAALSKEINDEGLLERFAPADLGQAAVQSTDDPLQGPVSPLSTL